MPVRAAREAVGMTAGASTSVTARGGDTRPDELKENKVYRERLFKYSAEGATTPETLRQKDRYRNNSGKKAKASPKD